MAHKTKNDQNTVILINVCYTILVMRISSLYIIINDHYSYNNKGKYKFCTVKWEDYRKLDAPASLSAELRRGRCVLWSVSSPLRYEGTHRDVSFKSTEFSSEIPHNVSLIYCLNLRLKVILNDFILLSIYSMYHIDTGTNILTWVLNS